MSALASLLLLQDLDLLQSEMTSQAGQRRLRKLGFTLESPEQVERARTKVVEELDRRWLNHYARAQSRYGRAVTLVRERVCQGCFITLPTSAAPAADESLTLCESCGRILYWG